jgi:hypothetical protein
MGVLDCRRQIMDVLDLPQSERAGGLRLTALRETFDYPLVLG